MTATAFDPEAKEADDYDTANTHLKFKVCVTHTNKHNVWCVRSSFKVQFKVEVYHGCSDCT